MTDLVQMSIEQMRTKGIKNHNKMNEQDKARQDYLKQQTSSEDFRRLYRDKGKQNTARVNSVISYSGAEDDIRKVLELADIHDSKKYIEALERIFNNSLTAYQLRELAKVLEITIRDTIEYAGRKNNS